MDDLQEKLREVLERHPDVLVAYPYGSVSRGTSGPLSDVDVAVLLRESGDLFKRRIDLIGEVSSVVGSERADVVVLNDVPVALGYRVLRDGVVLISRDETARIAHFAATVDRYLDMEPMRRALGEGVRHRIREGRVGRP